MNICGTKIMIFHKDRIFRALQFTYDNSELEIMNRFKYLSVFNKCVMQHYLVEKGTQGHACVRKLSATFC